MGVSVANEAAVELVDDWEGQVGNWAVNPSEVPLVGLGKPEADWHPAMRLTAGVICHRLFHPAIMTLPLASTASPEPYVGHQPS